MRKQILDTLYSKFEKNEAKQIEKMIYDMCKKFEIQSKKSLEKIYPLLAYEKLGILMNIDTSLDNSKEELDKIKQDITKCNIGWNNYIYKDFINEENNESFDNNVTYAKVKGVKICSVKNCKSDTFYQFRLQLRSGDEGQTEFWQCCVCGTRNRFNT